MKLTNDLETVLKYWLDQVSSGDDRPAEVVKALCELAWPGRTFRMEDKEFCDLTDAFDVLTGESAQDLYRREADRAHEPNAKAEADPEKAPAADYAQWAATLERLADELNAKAAAAAG